MRNENIYTGEENGGFNGQEGDTSVRRWKAKNPRLS